MYPGVTVPPFWVTILLNSDPNGNRSVRRPAGEIERRSKLYLSVLKAEFVLFLPLQILSRLVNMSECPYLLKWPLRAQKSGLFQNAVQTGGTELFSATATQDTAGV